MSKYLVITRRSLPEDDSSVEYLNLFDSEQIALRYIQDIEADNEYYASLNVKLNFTLFKLEEIKR